MCFKMIVYHSEMFSARGLSLGIADGLAQCAEQCVSIPNRNHQYDFSKNLCLGASFRCVNFFIPKILYLKKLDPNGSCKSGPLGLTKPCLLINAAFGTTTGWSYSPLTSISFLSSCWPTLVVKVLNLNFLPNFLSQTLVARTQPNAMTKTATQTEKNTTDVWTAQYQAECARSQILKIEFLNLAIERKFLQVLELHIPACSHLHTPGGKLLPQPRWLQTTLVDRFTRVGSNLKLPVQAT